MKSTLNLNVDHFPPKSWRGVDEAMAFLQGACCEITGLVAAAQHNGKRCTLLCIDDTTNRWQVMLDGGETKLSVKVGNLTQVVVVVDSSDDEKIAPSRRKKKGKAASAGGASDSEQIRSYFMPNPAKVHSGGGVGRKESMAASGQGGQGSKEADSSREPETVRKAPRSEPAGHTPGGPDREPK